ncbi:cell division control protein 6 like protein b [Quercus suber]|uniref:Cell division control protein 6 like protein b n=1 Tax=Quercus suber TaxID=58331 RepID=A0AAW0LGF0_QUESU
MPAIMAVKPDSSRSNPDSTPQKRRLRSDTTAAQDSPISTPVKWKSPRTCTTSSPKTPISVNSEQMKAVKEAMHVSTAPPNIVCREGEQKRVLEFCQACVEQEKAGSLYVCGCPGTGKSLSMEKVKQLLFHWANEILGESQPRKKVNGATSPLQHLQNLYSQKPQPSGMKMMLIIADELDYLITKDRAVLHDLFMLTTFPFSRCILIGIANAIDLADRFLPKLQSLNCKPMVVTFRAYSKDQILKILHERLMKVAAASGDMRKALCVCRSAIEMVEAELRESSSNFSSSIVEKAFLEQQRATAPDVLEKQEIDVVRLDHMVVALSKTYKSPIVDTIQSLPQHQQILLCSAVKLFRGGKKDTTVGELNKFYMEICKSALIPPVGILELSSICRVLSDQGLLKLGQSREDKSKRVTLCVDEADISFALQGIRFFRNCLQ